MRCMWVMAIALLMLTENWDFLLSAAFGASAQSTSRSHFKPAVFDAGCSSFPSDKCNLVEKGNNSLVLSVETITDEEGNIATYRRKELTLRSYLAAILCSDCIHHHHIRSHQLTVDVRIDRPPESRCTCRHAHVSMMSAFICCRNRASYVLFSRSFHGDFTCVLPPTADDLDISQ